MRGYVTHRYIVSYHYAKALCTNRLGRGIRVARRVYKEKVKYIVIIF